MHKLCTKTDDLSLLESSEMWINIWSYILSDYWAAVVSEWDAFPEEPLMSYGWQISNLHRWPDVYLGLTTMGQNMSIPSLQRALSHAFSAGPASTTSSSASESNQPVVTAELMVHPGYPSHPQTGGCGEGPDDFSQSADRRHEVSVLKDPSLLALYRQERVQLCAFKDLWFHNTYTRQPM